jgi:hypothetical protein
MYLDGVLVNSIDTSSTFTSIAAHGDEGFIGGTTGGSAFGTETGSFDGLIDEFRITTTTLDPELIANLSTFTFNTAYYWSVLANDTINVVNEERQFLVDTPNADIEIINISTGPLLEGVNTTISAYVNNTGTTIENDVLVEFIIDGTISINRTINTSPGVINEVNISYFLEAGTTQVDVSVDPTDVIIEIDETNNDESENITISSWAIYYGVLDLERVVGNNNSASVFTWFEEDATGSIYVIDSDATINFANLYALGRNTSNENSTNDFLEVDQALNLTGRDDSISTLFSIDLSTPRETRTFTIDANTYLNVPVTNTTNSSTFQTGILWDATSDTTGEYDENETLVFIANVEHQLQGLYGIYDYELRVPFELARTEGVVNTLDVFVELE